MISDHAHYFPLTEWGIREDELRAEIVTLAETLFAQANGYMGTRGTFEEGINDNATTCEGTYLNGIYLREKIVYEESAYAFATHNHKMIQVPDGKSIRLLVDGEAFTPSMNDVVHHQREFDFKTGMVVRTTLWKTAKGKQIEITSKRLVSLADQHVMAIELTVKPIDCDADITLVSALDAAYGADVKKDENDPRAGHLSITDSLDELQIDAQEHELVMLHQVKHGSFVIGSAATHQANNLTFEKAEQAAGKVTASFTTSLKAGEAATLHKYVSYHDGVAGDDNAIKARLNETLEKAKATGFDGLSKAQAETLEAFWSQANITVEGDPALQQGIRFNLFHILQSTGKDGKRAIGAKGLTGPGYDGHYFWDTEIYIIPFFVFTQPEVARKLLEFRYGLLESSRERARQMSHSKGALYAWRTIGGEECSAFFPAGTAQYHINAAIAYAIHQYLDATQDWGFMREYGAEMLCETARIWADMGHFNERKGGQFCIHEVTGPDEYSAMADNNFYTNAMARLHLREAARALQVVQSDYPEDYARITQAMALEEGEIELWQRAADKMYLPYDEALGIHEQHDGFLDKPKWDFANTPKDNYPLLLNYHPLVIYRHQVLKQADVVLAMMLLGDEFDAQTRRKNLDFYTPITTHDSTLSTCIYSIESSRLGEPDNAYRLFEETARMDIDNRHHNTEYGLHTACMAGSWMCIVMGFAGLEIRDGVLHFAPHLPDAWQGYEATVLYRGTRIGIAINGEEITFTHLEGEACRFMCSGDAVDLNAGETKAIPLQQKRGAA